MNPRRWLHHIKKDKLSLLVVATALVLVIVLGVSMVQKMAQPRTTVHLGDGVFMATIAATDATRQKGLSHSAPLAPNQAMLFDFGQEAKWGIWMKDMSYPIDVVWLDSERRVVYIVKNMPPESYPEQTFSPTEPARYVIELPAGTVEKKAISPNSVARFTLGGAEAEK